MDGAAQGRLSLAKTVLGLRGLPHNGWLDSRKEHRHITATYMVEILSTLSTSLIERIIMGTLPIASRTNDMIKAELQGMKTLRDQNPGIYIMYLVDAEGLGPSWNEWIPVLKMLELYAGYGVEAENIAMQLDLVRHKAKRNKHFFERRKYLLTDSDTKKYELIWSEKRRMKLFEFIGNVRGRMAEVEHTADRDTRHRRPMSEVGYGIRPDARIRSHMRHDSTNFIMALCDAAFQIAHEDCGFGLEGHVVAVCHRMEHGASGEVLISTMASAYITSGSGFSYHMAGASNHSAEDITYMRWREIQGEVAADEKYVQRMEAEIVVAARVKGTMNVDVNGAGGVDVRAELGELESMAATAAGNWERAEAGIRMYEELVKGITRMKL